MLFNAIVSKKKYPIHKKKSGNAFFLSQWNNHICEIPLPFMQTLGNEYIDLS